MKAGRSDLLRSFVQILFLSCTIVSSNAALIRTEKRGGSLVSLAKRTVTYGDTGNKDSSSSVCNDEQKKILEKSMGEAAKLAKAGFDGLDIILDMLSDQKTKYHGMEEKQRHRYKDTFFTFFGAITKKDQIDTAKDRVQFIRERLERLKDLSVESWPSAIKIYCDSTYYQDKDDEGQTWDQKEPPLPALSNPATKEWKFDYDVTPGEWSEVLKQSNCHGTRPTAGYTLPFNDQKSDRMTFCPEWFNKVKEAGTSLSDINPAEDIKEGAKLQDFARKSARIFLHEHLHTWTINQEADTKIKLADTESPTVKSYGFENAASLALTNQVNARRNIENVVYWCISMYFDTWNWKTGSAAVL